MYYRNIYYSPTPESNPEYVHMSPQKEVPEEKSGGLWQVILDILKLKIEVIDTNGGWKEWTGGEEPCGPCGTATDPSLRK